MNIDTKMAQRVNEFVNAVQSLINQSTHKNYPDEKLTILPGRRYLKIVRRWSAGAGGSVYCFIDSKNGDILKAASWSAPAPRGVRGNIFNPNYDLKCCDRYGLKYIW